MLLRENFKNFMSVCLCGLYAPSCPFYFAVYVIAIDAKHLIFFVTFVDVNK